MSDLWLPQIRAENHVHYLLTFGSCCFVYSGVELYVINFMVIVQFSWSLTIILFIFSQFVFFHSAPNLLFITRNSQMDGNVIFNYGYFHSLQKKLWPKTITFHKMYTLYFTNTYICTVFISGSVHRCSFSKSAMFTSLKMSTIMDAPPGQWSILVTWLNTFITLNSSSTNETSKLIWSVF